MFTGIITDIGRVRRIDRGAETRFTIETRYDTTQIPMGASIACSGVCLTVVDKGAGWFAADVSGETLSCTTLASLGVGALLNLERALKAGDELGGHIVSGHVDGVAQVVDRRPEGGSLRLEFEAPPDLARLVAPKGSVAIEGVSLTVNAVDGRRFGVNIIPHTQQETTLGRLAAGDRVNMEIDMLARYVARLLQGA
ncbi:MAG: riboflavin synthase [Alphaproteobacteria bacterium]